MLKTSLKQARKQVRTWMGLTPAKDRSIGIIDALERDHLRGWFITRWTGPETAVAAQTATHRFMVFLDDQSLGTFEATLDRPDVQAAEGVLSCGFDLDLAPLLAALPRGRYTLHDGAEHRLSLRTVRGRTVAEKTVTGTSPLRGFLDKLDSQGLHGWAIDESRPNQPIELGVYLNGVHFLDIKTSLPRGDLAAKGMPSQNAGFSLQWPAGLVPIGTVVDVRCTLSGLSLSKSPQTLAGGATSPMRATLGYLDQWRQGGLPSVTVIVPIYNAFEAVQDCLASLERHLPRYARLLLINDASPDPRIAPMLAAHAQRPGVTLITNEHNLGYTCTVNKAIASCPQDDIVLLNSDTVTTARWLDNLRYCAYAQARVATVTAMSDHAGAFSAPEIGTFNPVPEHLSRDSHARLITQGQHGRLLEVPTGNGFCLYMRRAALDTVGLFDERKFPRGYGEENDFCMRAWRTGWTHLVCDKAYVFHKRSQSFQGEKAALMEAGAAQLGQDYPEYRLLTPRFRDLEFAFVRHLARAALQHGHEDAAQPRLLYVISTQTGGTPQTNMDLMQAMAGHYQCFLLRCDAKVVTLSVLQGAQLSVLESWPLSRPIEAMSHRSDEYDRAVTDLLYRHSIDLLHIRHVGWHSLGLAEAARSLNIPVVYSSHDFYAVCPSLNLLDEQMQTCAGRCTAGEGQCQVALWPPQSLPVLKHRFVHRWREMLGQFLSHCDHVITTADSAARILAEAHPAIRDRLQVIPHGRNFGEWRLPSRRPTPGQRLKVLVPGNITASKGAQLLCQLAALDTEQRIEWHFLGHVDDTLKNIGVHHGTYERQQFFAKVDAIGPHLGVVLSVWPETYCHTLTEMWACGLPVMGFDVGAVGERLRATGAGWTLPLSLSPADVLQQLYQAADDSRGFQARQQAVLAWQDGEGTWNTTGHMARAYRHVYQRLLHSLSPSAASPRALRRVGLLVKGQHSHPATVHIRLLRHLAQLPQHDVSPITVDALVQGRLTDLDVVVIQRDAVPAARALEVIEALRQQSCPYVYEIDDLLWQLPPHHTDHSIDAAQCDAMRTLMRHAAQVTTSTEPLAAAVAAFNPRVTVVPNALDLSLWRRPLDPKQQKAVWTQHQLHDHRPRLLYMGTRSHASDLALIVPAIEQLLQRHPDLDIVQIGGGTLLPQARLLPVPKEHSSYPAFVTWFRMIAASASVALAPLEDIPFNHSKSDIKTLDYGLAQVAAVYSRVGPYRQGVIDGVTGVLCDNEPQAWVQAVHRLLAEPAWRNSLVQAALERACARSHQAQSDQPWLTLLDQVCQVCQVRSAPAPAHAAPAVATAAPIHETLAPSLP